MLIRKFYFFAIALKIITHAALSTLSQADFVFSHKAYLISDKNKKSMHFFHRFSKAVFI